MLPQPDVPLSPLTTLGVGGQASFFTWAADEAQAQDALTWAREHGLPVFLLGGGSNLVVADAGVRGLVLRFGAARVRYEEPHGDLVRVQADAGVSWDSLVAEAVRRNLQGLECLSGIPGLVGATPIQNVGAYGQEVSEAIEEVRCLDLSTGSTLRLSGPACGFGYRDSIFKQAARDRYLVTRVTFLLRHGAPPAVRYTELEQHLGGATATLGQVRDAVLTLRQRKSMVLSEDDPNRRSCGSFFVNPLVGPADLAAARERTGKEVPHHPQADGRFKVPAAWLIEQAGFPRGYREGPVGLSTRHCLALVAHEGASAARVIGLAQTIRKGVEDSFGVRLRPEPCFWGFDTLDDGLPVNSDAHGA